MRIHLGVANASGGGVEPGDWHHAHALVGASGMAASTRTCSAAVQFRSTCTELIQSLPCWTDRVVYRFPLSGLTNISHVVEHDGCNYIVRLDGDIPEHNIKRSLEQAASLAAAVAGISPPVLYAEGSILVRNFIAAQALAPTDVEARLDEVLDLVGATHALLAMHLPVAFSPERNTYSPVKAIRQYLDYLRSSGSGASDLLVLRHQIDVLAAKAGSEMPVVFCHNDLLAANILDDGSRLWLIDWDYAGFGDPGFDLAGLALNNGLSESTENWLLKNYEERLGVAVQPAHYYAVKALAALREALWARVSALHPRVNFDYSAYAELYFAKYQQAWERLR